MAKETALELWIGVDHQYIFEVLNDEETLAVDVTGWTLSWMVKRYSTDADAEALLTKTTSSGIAVAGTYAAVRTTNTQRTTVTVADTDTDAISPGLCRCELKRTTAGSETILAYGPIRLRQSVHRT